MAHLSPLVSIAMTPGSFAPKATDPHFRAIFDHAPIGMALVGATGEILEANPQLLALTGASPRTGSPASLASLTHIDDRVHCDSMLTALQRGERPSLQTELRVRHGDGSYRLSRLTLSVAVRSGERAEQLLAMLEDLEEVRQQGHALDERVKELHAIYTISRRLLSAGSANLPQTLQELAELLPAAFQFPELAEARVRLGTLEAQTAGFAHGHEMLRTEWGAGEDASGSIEVQYVGPTPAFPESPFLPEERAMLESVADLVRIATVGLMKSAERDMAQEALRVSEERLQVALEAARMGTIEWDLQTEQAHISEVTRQLCGLPEGTTTADILTFRSVIHPDHRDEVERQYRAELGGAPARELEYRLVRPDGSVRWVAVRARVFFDAKGVAQRRVGVIVDVTSRHVLEEQFRHAQKMEAVGRLAGGVAHDFNNLLTVIGAAAEFAHPETADGSQLQADVQDIMDAVERARALTTQLLTFSRRQVVRLSQLDLNDVVAGTDKMLQRLIGADATLTLMLADEPVPLLADGGQIEQVLVNLVVNARDAMPAGGLITVSTALVSVDESLVELRPDLSPGHYALLTVSDTGTGMDEATQARVFEPFFTTKEAGKGTGLGLATVFGIVKQASGHIVVYSEPGLGTAFRIYLPRSISSGEVVDDAALSPTAVVTGHETILLVEDEPHVRAVAQRVLSECGYTVLEAETADSALRVTSVHHAPIDLLLSDVVLPGWNGRELADALMRTYPAMRVLFMSGYTSDALLHHRITESGTPFIEKPFTRARLALAVRSALDGAAPRRGDGVHASISSAITAASS